MKRIILSLIVGLPMFGISQTTILTENFDAYSDLDYAGVVSPWMSTWTLNPGGADDCQVTSAEFSSLSNSIAITGPNAGGAIDAMVIFPSNYSTGRYQFSCKFKVAAGMGGYFNAQASGTVPGQAWMVQTYLAEDGTGTAEIGGLIEPFNYSNGAWIDIMIDCDLDSDMAHLWIEGVEVGTGFQWSLESGGLGTGANATFGGINFYSAGAPAPATADCEYYVDDIMLVQMPASGAGVEEVNSIAAINVVPNPSNGNFNLNYSDMNMENATITIVDLLGKTMYTKTNSVIGNGSLNLDLNLRNGVYFVSIASGATKMTKRIVVKK